MKQGGLWVCVSKTVCGFLECMCIKKKKKKKNRAVAINYRAA